MMKYRFADTGNYLYTSGAFYLGIDDQGREIGVSSERHAATIAGARAGKGTCQIIPTLLRWPENSLTVDPSGENVAATWQALEAAGKKVVLLDPFHHAERHFNVPARLRASVNLLDGVTAESLTAREDIRVIADGLVKRYKVEDGTWDNGAVSVLAGFIAYVLADPDPANRTLSMVRHLLTMPPETLQAIFTDMSEQEGFGKLARAAATIGLSKTKKAAEYLGSAVDHSDWLDSPPFVELLGSSSLSLSELKTGNVAVFLVVPHEYVIEHSRFLRLFVRCALDAMTKGGKRGKRCLFLLDEFFSLGTIDELAKAAGALPKFGVHLWPFLQDLGQLIDMYGETLAETFFGNSDATCFFGNTDPLTTGHISDRLGIVSADEIPPPPLIEDLRTWQARKHKEGTFLWGSADELSGRHQAEQANTMLAYEQAKSSQGSPRAAPEVVAAYVGRGTQDDIARRMIVFAKAGDVLSVKPWAYFWPKPVPPEKPAAPAPRPRRTLSMPWTEKVALWASVLTTGAVVPTLISHLLPAGWIGGAIVAAISIGFGLLGAYGIWFTEEVYEEGGTAVALPYSLIAAAAVTGLGMLIGLPSMFVSGVFITTIILGIANIISGITKEEAA